MGNPDVTIIYTASPYIQHGQLRLNGLHNQYLKTGFVSKKNFEILQKVWKIRTGAQAHTVNFIAANRYFDWLEIIFGKSDQYLIIYDSFNVEVAAKIIRKVEIENITNTYSVSNEFKFNLTDSDHKNVLYKKNCCLSL